MEIYSIIMIACIFILLYIIYYYYFSSSSMLMSSVVSGTQITAIDVSKIDNGLAGSVNFAYSLWFNINDWNYRYGSEKIIFRRESGASITTGSTTTTYYTPKVSFAGSMNNLNISITTGTLTSPVSNSYSVSNVPIQKWVHLIVSVYGKSLDVYINGKLVNTFVLQGVPLIDQTKQIVICPDGGFKGWVTQFQFWASAMDPQNAWNIYKSGNGSSIFNNLFGNYGVKLALLNNNIEQNSITL